MIIQARTVYTVGGVDFDSEVKARAWVYDQIGNTLDKALSDAGIGTMGPKERIACVDAMVKHGNTFSLLLGAYTGKVES